MNGISRFGNFCNAVGTSTSKNDNIKEGVGSKAIGTMDGSTGGFSCGKEAWYNMIGLESAVS